MGALLIVVAHVDESDREAFDQWYETEHLPDAKRAFAARRAWRGWNEVSPEQHFAFYEFADVKTALETTNSNVIKELIEEFDERWQGRITRTRNVIENRQVLN